MGWGLFRGAPGVEQRCLLPNYEEAAFQRPGQGVCYMVCLCDTLEIIIMSRLLIYVSRSCCGHVYKKDQQARFPTSPPQTVDIVVRLQTN